MDAEMLRDMFCMECSLQFNKKIVYDLHLSLVHGKKTGIKQEPNNSEVTSEDDKVFNENADKAFVSKICDSELTYQDDLDVHEGNIPIKRENERLKCVKCDKGFTTNFVLKRHLWFYIFEKT